MLVRQPNGLYAWWSNGHSTFGLMNLTEDQALTAAGAHHRSDRVAQLELLDAKQDRVGTRSALSHAIPDGLDRWRECLHELEVARGVSERIRIEEAVRHTQ